MRDVCSRGDGNSNGSNEEKSHRIPGWKSQALGFKWNHMECHLFATSGYTDEEGEKESVAGEGLIRRMGKERERRLEG